MSSRILTSWRRRPAARPGAGVEARAAKQYARPAALAPPRTAVARTRCAPGAVSGRPAGISRAPHPASARLVRLQHHIITHHSTSSSSHVNLMLRPLKLKCFPQK